MEYVMNDMGGDRVFPMHRWRQYDLISKFKRRPQLGRLADKVVEMDRENMMFDIEGE